MATRGMVRGTRQRRRFVWVWHMLSVVMALGLALGANPVLADVGYVDVNPNSSDLDPTNPNGAAGGRINGLASVPGNTNRFYAASEWGGLFQTNDNGVTWFRLNGHRPVAAWDVEVDPSNIQRVYATSFYDGLVNNSQAGINISTDGGATWAKPATATPPGGFNCAAARITEPGAFGIGIRADANQNVAIGTNCGVALSTNSGATWTFVDPTPGDAATDVWDVVYQGGGPTGQGIIDVCGADRHRRSTDGGATWTGGSAQLPAGRCSIAVSPDENYVLFVFASDNNVYESDDGGANWTNLGTPDSRRQGRIPFVAVNNRADAAFDVWVGDVSLFRAGCTTPNPPAQGGANRCPVARTGAPATPPPAGWAGPFTRTTGAHDDAGDLVFDTAVAVDACPRQFSSDGGVYRNTDAGGDCHNPDWEQPNTVPHALWIYGMDGADRAGDAAEDLYFGLQDAGGWGTQNAGASPPTWHNEVCCDVFDIAADANRVVYSVCCGFSVNRANPGMTGSVAIATNPPGNIPSFRFADFIQSIGNNQYIAVTSNGAYLTSDITANPVVWTQLGAASTPAGGFCAVHTGFSGGTPTFYGQTACIPNNNGIFEAAGSSQLWSYTGTAANGTWTRVDNNSGLTGGFGIVGVDPNNPNRLYASHLAAAGPQMVFSTDGGTNWNFDPELDTMMTGNGAFRYQTQRGVTPGPVFNVGYAQPSLLAYDPENANILVAGGRDSGVFLSTNGGQDWSLITDPLTSHTSGRPHLPRPWFAYFDHEPATRVNVYVGTQGRGVWRLSLGLPTANAGGPYNTNEGTNVTLTGSGSDPDGGAVTLSWDLDNDGAFDDATGTNPTFDLVGQDGVYTVRLKVTTAGGAFTVATTTVTVNNVAPSVSLNSDGPKPENSPITVSGVVSDPGWLDPLSATINWGDGTPVQAISGTLENVRPDATLTFSIAHTYGDDGTFTADVCANDDDTQTCQSINLTITNVNPTAVIDETDAILINGIPTFLAHAGVPIDFKGRSTDPGSDDLDLSWDWDDGPPSPDVTTTYLVNPPLTDPDPSPSIQPRDVTDQKTHAFGKACLYVISFLALDDDAGTGKDQANVIIVGNALLVRSAGYWQVIYDGKGPKEFDTATLQCYLKIVGYMSQVFNEVRDASTIEKATAILKVNGNNASMSDLLDRQLLAAWLNFANGAVEYDELVDTNGDKVPDTKFSDAVAAAEAVRLNPASTKAQLEDQMKILERINLMDGG